MKFTGENLKEIIFPLGGIGTGSVGIAGNGALVDWEIFNKPNKGSLNGYTHFAVRAEKPDGTVVFKVLQGDHIRDLMGKYAKRQFSGYGYGPAGDTMAGFPHFKKVTFDGKFPIATLTFEDDDFPAKIFLKAFNPFIPLDSKNSSLPAAFFDIQIKSLEDNVHYTVAFSVQNPFAVTKNTVVKKNGLTAIELMHGNCEKSAVEYGDITVATDAPDATAQAYWYRGIWMDKITTFWRELKENSFRERDYPFDEKATGDMCTLVAQKTVFTKKRESFRFVLSWNVPNCVNYWAPVSENETVNPIWKNYYTTLFKNSTATALYSLRHWGSFYRKTNDFCKALHSSTLDPAVIDAVSSTVSVLKSPTVLRLEDGTLYGWEGAHEESGSCEGTCTHVWSYAYALCFLFPDLERSMRETELKNDTNEHGEMRFRTPLPIGRAPYYPLPPCVDGQMATIIKIYRDWKITGNTAWLTENWSDIKRVLEFAWNENNDYRWDRDKDGILEGRQHHTLDMELFGPSAWLEGIYLCALKAASEMAQFLGETEKALEYSTLFENGYRFTKENLFNGKYFFHKIDLSNKKYVEDFDCPQYWFEEGNQLKYQIGEGCEIDQLLGQWHANVCGLGSIFDKTQVKTALDFMFKNNFKKSLRGFTNMWRNFALNDEGGTVICDYPEGCNKPNIPIPYCEECMTGFEYAFCGLLISEGYVSEGLEGIRAIRNRYDGKKRNPWNEIECGSNYARAMSSFALLPIFSGLTFDMPHKAMGFKPILEGNFKCFFSLSTGWGQLVREEKLACITLLSGALELSSVSVEKAFSVKAVYADGCRIDFKLEGESIVFAPITFKKELRFEY